MTPQGNNAVLFCAQLKTKLQHERNTNIFNLYIKYNTHARPCRTFLQDPLGHGAGPRPNSIPRYNFSSTSLGFLRSVAWLTQPMTKPRERRIVRCVCCAYEQGGYPIHACQFRLYSTRADGRMNASICNSWKLGIGRHKLYPRFGAWPWSSSPQHR